MKRTIFFGCLWLLLFPLAAQQADVYDEKVTSAGNIGATLSNLGVIGNAFSGSFNVRGFPSCEYPVNSGIEHVFQGGLWIGALKDGQTVVTTGAVDDPSGYATGKGGFEFTSKTSLTERSSLFDSPFFTPEAVSHQDYVSTFTDTSVFVYTNTGRIPIQDHVNPLDVQVDFESYNWNFNFSNFFIILNFQITNVGTTPLDSVYIGYWMDGVIRNVNITPPGGTPFFNKGGNGFVDSLNMGYEFDATGDPGFTDSYVACKYLGAELNGQCPSNPNFGVNYNTWQFRATGDPVYFFPRTDLQRYGKLANGLDDLDRWETDIQPEISTPNNRSNLVSAGPFTTLRPGEQLDVAFAIICARRVFDGNPARANTVEQRANLLQNAGWAQTAYNGEDLNGNCILDPAGDRNGDGIIDPAEDRDGDGRITRFVLPTPPEVPKTRVVARDRTIEVFWTDNAERSIDPISNREDFEGYRLYKTAVGFDVQNTQDIINELDLIGSWDIPGNSLAFDNGLEDIRLEDPVTFEGDTTKYYYRYIFDNVLNGWQHVISVTAFDQGDEVNNLLPLESARLANLSRVFPGKPANDAFANGDPFVYPNPYYAQAAWEGPSQFEEDRKIVFANLPARCEIRIYSLSGDLIDVLDHDEAYDGSDIRWYQTYSDSEEAKFSGGEHAWDLLSADNQIIARGLYLFVVIDRDTNEKKRGKFVVIK